MSNSTPNQSFTGLYSVLDLMDPRSPTTVFQRTPIQVILKDSAASSNESICELVNDFNSSEAVETSENCFSMSSIADELEKTKTSESSSSFLTADDMDVEENLLSCNPSPTVSEINTPDTTEKPSVKLNSETLPETPKATDESESECFLLENSLCEKSSEDSFLESKIELKNPAKKLFYTPNKKRTPLTVVDNICPVTPPVSLPQNVLRQKQWKRIQEERKKLGLDGDENLPLPLYDVTASAPGKLMHRKKKIQARFNM